MLKLILIVFQYFSFCLFLVVLGAEIFWHGPVNTPAAPALVPPLYFRSRCKLVYFRRVKRLILQVWDRTSVFV